MRARGHPISISEIRKWLKEQETYTLHKPIRRKFKRQHTRVTSIDEHWQLDLADVSQLKKENDGKPVYCVISMYSLNMLGWCL